MTGYGSWPLVALGEVIFNVQSGFSSGERTADGVVQLRMNNVSTDGGLDLSNHIRVPTTTSQIAKYGLQPGDVLFNSTNSLELVGKTAVFAGFPEPVVFSNHFARLRVVPDKLDPFYLAHWLLVKWQQRIFEHLATAWVNQASVRKEDLLDLHLSLPPLAEQQRIAGMLRRADRLRRLRRYALELSAGYLQAVFVEMFGDPVRNPMGWERATLAELGKIQTGNTPSRDDPTNFGDHIEWIKSDNILDDHIYVSASREGLSEQGLRQGRMVAAGAVLMTCIAGSLSSIGSVALTNRNVAFNQQINAISPASDVNSFFLYQLCRQAQPLIQHNASDGMKHIITKSKLEEILLYKPPHSRQMAFAHVVERYARIRIQQDEALRQAEHLFQALLQREFGRNRTDARESKS